MTKPDDADIVAALKKDPEKGFRLLMSRYKEAVYWHVRRLVVSHDDAQDATQETFIRVFRNFRQWRGDSSFTAWVYRISTNEALRMISRRRQEQVSLDDAGSTLAGVTADSYVDYTDLEAVKLQKAILSLPLKQQLAFNLRYYEEMSYDDIAAVTGLTAVNMKANYHVAEKKIIKYMNSLA